MKFNEIIRAAMKETGTNQTRLGEALGVRQTAVSNVLLREDIMLSTFIEYMDKLGYDIIIQSSDSKMILTNEEE